MDNGPRLVLAVGLAMVTAPAAAQALDDVGTPSVNTTGDAGWQFSVSPYLWMSSLKGDLGVAEQVEPVGIDMTFSTFWMR